MLLFFGYIVLVAVMVLYWSSLHVQASDVGVEPQFESEVWPQLGLLFLGTPFLLALFLLKLRRGPDHATEHEPEHEHDTTDAHEHGAAHEGEAPEPAASVAPAEHATALAAQPHE